MAEKNPFEEFVNDLEMDLPEKVPEKDKDVEMVDEALAKWITEQYPQGFEFNPGMREAIIIAFKEARRIAIKFPVFVYLDAILKLCWDESNCPITAMRAAMVFGFAFKRVAQIEEEDEPSQ